ncbi:MAG: glycosyltransferase family 39 protein [Candidatus Sulfotelmatobacter sp.]
MLPPEAAVNQKPGDPAPSVQRVDARVSLLLLALLTAAAGLVRFLFLTRKPFWFDECFSVEVSRLGWGDFAHLLWWREANMSLYYLLLRAWLHFGQGPFFIRSLSVVIALATLPAIYWVASQLFDRRVGIIAVALLAFNAYHVRYAQEVRSYALLALLATLSSGYFVACLRKPSERNRLGYALVSVLAVYSHLYALLLVGAHYASLRTWKVPQQKLRRVWLWIGVAVVPLLVFAAKTGAGPIRWIPRPGIHELFAYGERMAGNDGLLLLLLYAAACTSAILPQGKRLFTRPAEWETWRYQLLLIWLVFPVILTVLLSLARPLFLARYFIFCLPALIILAAAGLAGLRTWLLGIGLVAMLALSLQGTLSYYDHDFDLGRDASGAAANYILNHAQPGDVILFHIAGTRIPYEFYRSLRDQNRSASDGKAASTPEIIYPRHGDQLDYRDFTGKPAPDFVRSLSTRYPRVWVVLMDNETTAGPDAVTVMLNQTLGESFLHMQRSDFPRVEVRLYSQH